MRLAQRESGAREAEVQDGGHVEQAEHGEIAGERQVLELAALGEVRQVLLALLDVGRRLDAPAARDRAERGVEARRRVHPAQALLRRRRRDRRGRTSAAAIGPARAGPPPPRGEGRLFARSGPAGAASSATSSSGGAR
jgi:hypothetical protein